MAEFPPPPNIAPQDDGSGVAQEPVRDASEPAPITDQEVGEYREQDRFLPVRLLFSFFLSFFLFLFFVALCTLSVRLFRTKILPIPPLVTCASTYAPPNHARI